MVRTDRFSIFVVVFLIALAVGGFFALGRMEQPRGTVPPDAGSCRDVVIKIWASETRCPDEAHRMEIVSGGGDRFVLMCLCPARDILE